MSERDDMRVRNTGEAAAAYQRVTLTGQYLLASMGLRRMLGEVDGSIGCLVDFGCGGGKSLWPSVPFLETQGQVVGVDISEDQLAFARERLKPVEQERPDLTFRFQQVDSTGRLEGLGSDVADVVQTSIVLQELRDHGALSRFAEEAFRVLRPGGVLMGALVGDRITDEEFVSFTYSGFPSNLKEGSIVRSCRSIEGGIVWEDDRHWTREDMEDVTSCAGFEALQFEDVYADRSLPPFPAEPWRSWKDELTTPPILLMRCRKPVR